MHEVISSHHHYQVQYVGLESLETGDSFEVRECPSQLVVRMECGGLECGKRPARVARGDRETRELEDTRAQHGDWPWHVTLIKEGTHVCDGTLVHDHWVISTKSCFQG